MQALSDIKSDVKSNEQSQVYKLSTPMQIKEIILNASDLRGTKRVNEVSIYTNNSQNAELSAIKRDKSAWTFIMTMKVSEDKGEKKCKFPVPITACNLMFELHIVQLNKTMTTSSSRNRGYHSNPYGDYEYSNFNYNSYLEKSRSYQTFSVNNKDILDCPRCRITVEDSHGVCATCRENAFQCTFCRNINYENLEAFLCNECGLSRYGKYEFSILAKPDFAIEKIKNEKMKEDAENSLENTLIVAQNKYSKLSERRQVLIGHVKKLNGAEGTNPTADIQSLFGESVSLHHAMMKSLENAKSLRKELLEYEEMRRGDYHDGYNADDDVFADGTAMDVDSSSREDVGEISDCFGCTFSFQSVLLKFINETASIEEFNALYLDDEFLAKLYNENMKMFAANQRSLTKLALCKIINKNKDSTLKLLQIIEGSIYSRTKEGGDHVPHHLLSTVIREDVDMLASLSLALERLIVSKKADPGAVDRFNECLKAIVRILKYSVERGSQSAPIASELTVT